MTDFQTKSQETRLRNQEAKAALCEEQTAALKSARVAIQRVFDNSESTSEEILRAVELLLRLSTSRHY